MCSRSSCEKSMTSITIQAKTEQTKSSFCSTLLTVYVVRHCKLNSLRLAVINELFCLYVKSRSSDCVYDCFHRAFLTMKARAKSVCVYVCVCFMKCAYVKLLMDQTGMGWDIEQCIRLTVCGKPWVFMSRGPLHEWVLLYTFTCLFKCVCTL